MLHNLYRIGVTLHMDHTDARYIAHLQDVSKFLMKNLSDGDVLLVLSAGDANQISQDLLNYLKSHIYLMNRWRLL